MTAAGWAVLILAVALAVTVVVAALWLRSRGRAIARGLAKAVRLQHEIEALQRAAALTTEAGRVEGLTDDQVLAELVDHPGRRDSDGS